MYTWIFIVVCLLGASCAEEVCYDELGCFNDLPPWGGTEIRPNARLPWDPEMIGTRFLLFTQRNRYYQEITADADVIKASNYNKLTPTRFVIPGFPMKGDMNWPEEMCKTMVHWERVNCIAIDWTNGMKAPYAQAVNNARVVATQTAHMINFLLSYFRQKADKFHLIGHSIGAHIAGEAGTLVPQLGRITGLDPMEPYFQDADPAVRLDASDANFVDVIHTDALPFVQGNFGLGVSKPAGHLDFYPNGGELMPGCTKNKGSPNDLDGIWEGTIKFDDCNHGRAYEYYMESIVKPLGFTGYPCTDYKSFIAGLCFPCSGESCPLMGHSAAKFDLGDVATTGSMFFLETGQDMPYGRHFYRAKVLLAGAVWPNPGYMFVSIVGDREQTEEFQLHVGMLSPGSTYELLIQTPADLGEPTSMTFKWYNHIFNPMSPKYGAEKIELVRGKDKKTFNFCSDVTVGENDIQTVMKC